MVLLAVVSCTGQALFGIHEPTRNVALVESALAVSHGEDGGALVAIGIVDASRGAGLADVGELCDGLGRVTPKVEDIDDQDGDACGAD